MPVVCIVCENRGRYKKTEQKWEEQENTRLGIVAELKYKRIYKSAESFRALLMAIEESEKNTIVVLEKLTMIDDFEEFKYRLIQKTPDNIIIRVIDPYKWIPGEARTMEDINGLLTVQKKFRGGRNIGACGIPPLSEEKIEDIRKARREGGLIKEIASDHLVSPASVLKYTKDIRLKRKKRDLSFFLQEPVRDPELLHIHGHLKKDVLRFLRTRNNDRTKKQNIRQLTDLCLYYKGRFKRDAQSFRDFDADFFCTYVIYLENQGRKTSDIRGRIFCFRSFYNWLKNNGEIKNNPVLNAPVPPDESRATVKTRPAGPDEIRDMIEILKQDFRSEKSRLKREITMRNLAIVYCLPLTGIRYSALMLLRVCDFYKEGENYRLNLRYHKKNSNKGYGSAVIGIDLKAAKILEDFISYCHKDSAPEDPLFFGQNRSAPVANSTVNSMIKKYARKAGVRADMSCHSFRATFGTQNKDLSDKELQLRMMHKDIRSSLKYQSPHLDSMNQGWMDAPVDDLVFD